MDGWQRILILVDWFVTLLNIIKGLKMYISHIVRNGFQTHQNFNRKTYFYPFTETDLVFINDIHTKVLVQYKYFIPRYIQEMLDIV